MSQNNGCVSLKGVTRSLCTSLTFSSEEGDERQDEPGNEVPKTMPFMKRPLSGEVVAIDVLVEDRIRVPSAYLIPYHPCDKVARPLG